MKLGSKPAMPTPPIALPLETIAEFCDRHQVIEFALFGSVLRNDFRSDSDIDVMVQFHPEAQPTFSTLDQMESEVTYSYTDATAYSVGFSVTPAIASDIS
jgi:predicted nucleotidyltransferase